MDIKIRDSKRLKSLAKEFHRTPTTFVNDIVNGFSYPPGFKDEARKHSFKTAFARALWRSYYGQKLEEEVYAILGKHDYHIDDGEIDLQKRTFWFQMYFSTDEKIIDMDSIHVQFDEGSVILSATHTLEGISPTNEKLDEAIVTAEEEIEFEFDVIHSDLALQDPVFDDKITIEFEIQDEHFSYLPKLKEINDVLDKAEYIIRKNLK